MNFLAILILALMALLGGVATAQHHYEGTPFLVIGVLGLGLVLGRRFFPNKTPNGDGGE